jgi:hypothetical protein
MSQPTENIVNESFIDSFFGDGPVTPADTTAVENAEDNEKNKSIFKKESEDGSSLNSFIGLDNEEEEEKEEKQILANVIGQKPATPATITNSNLDLTNVVSELVKDSTLIGYDVEDFKISSVEEFKELITANKEEWKKEWEEESREEILNDLPAELQYVVDYARNGGSDFKTLFKVLSQSEEVMSLDPLSDGEQIVKTYLTHTNFGTPEEIQDQIKEWEELDVLSKKADIFKPKLDKIQEQILSAKLQEQEERKTKDQALVTKFFTGVQDALKDKNLNGLTLSKEEQSIIYSDLTQNNYVSARTGQPVNFLGKFLEDIAWEKPDYKLLAELTLFAKNPEAYREKIRQGAKTSEADSTARKLRTSQGAFKPTSSQGDDNQTFVIPKKTITRNSILRK